MKKRVLIKCAGANYEAIYRHEIMYIMMVFKIFSVTLMRVILCNGRTSQLKRPCNLDPSNPTFIIEPRSEKTGLRGFRPGPTQTAL